MDDNLSEKEQIEQLKKWWKENGSSLITGLLLGVSLLFGSKTWMNWQDTQKQNASNIYAQMQSALKQNDTGAARTQAGELISNYSKSGYAPLAALVLAKLAMQEDETGAAQSQLEWALDHAKTPQLAHIARSRLIRVLIDEKKYTQAEALLSGVTDGGEYRYIYTELQGDLAFAQGEMKRAASAYRDALAVLPERAPNAAYLQVKYENITGVEAETQ
ncbi:hypothetical protein MNBD_GAMMA15-1702 [hydrothermal vent metagenome]|uniref:Ancillary SecYEG translocon subunit n=1 Tax=hydrothermal vent metagenome TaxID=652676 RepID=A0A3B0Z509_9ZZZZ